MAISHATRLSSDNRSKRKEERLRYLKNYWAEQVVNVPKVKLNTSLKPEFSCGLANFSIEGVEPKDIVTKLNDKYKIIAVPWK